MPNKTVDKENDKQLFTIYGRAPIETSTLIVSRESDIYDLSKEKVITVIYLYEYEESDESGTNILPISERHIVNIHLQFKSGVPQIGQLTKPNTVLPGSTVGMKVPEVTTGAFEVLAPRWEVFANQDDASQHKERTALRQQQHECTGIRTTTRWPTTPRRTSARPTPTTYRSPWVTTTTSPT